MRFLELLSPSSQTRTTPRKEQSSRRELFPVGVPDDGLSGEPDLSAAEPDAKGELQVLAAPLLKPSSTAIACPLSMEETNRDPRIRKVVNLC